MVPPPRRAGRGGRGEGPQCRRPSSCYTTDISTSELLGVLVVVIVTWLVLKLARVAIRLIFFIIGLMLVAGVLYFFLSR